ncbi:hypothetical protein AB0D46_06480 [Streptomyces sp. NPDC048383]|uniref:hypothetical protein n=1 Tax=Streptomyces sp. NPDC048383 TaxID=3155386 RepID=UPI00341EF882
MSPIPAPFPRQSPRAAVRTPAPPAYPVGLDAMLDAVYETHRRFRHGVYAVPCTTCHVPAGELCRARRSVHAARRQAHRDRLAQHERTPFLAPLAA